MLVCSIMSTFWTERTDGNVLRSDLISPLVGDDILGLVTTGMYNNPLSLYREYIQNAADAAAPAASEGVRGSVEVDIDSQLGRIRIRDDGPGLSPREAARALVPIARSQKSRGIGGGFRGIGRLAGLAVAESVTFTTRAKGDAAVTCISWDGRKLRNKEVMTDGIDQRVGDCVRMETATRQHLPEHFFEVEINGIGRHVASLVLNREIVRAYIGEVCPVPFSPAFPFAPEVDSLLQNDAQKLNIVIQGDSTPVTRRHGESIQFANLRESCFTELEAVQIPALDGERLAAVGWIAHSLYLGAIPKNAGIRGIRARCGDIQVGDESVFDLLFKEERFNRWCVGEIHVMDPRIVPNGRRDYFELGPHVRHLENQLGPVVQGVSARCRRASMGRNRRRRLLDDLCRLEDSYDLASRGYFAKEDAQTLAASALQQVRGLREIVASSSSHVETYLGALESVERQLRDLQAKPTESALWNMSPLEAATYQKAFMALAEVSPSPRAAGELIEAVLHRVSTLPPPSTNCSATVGVGAGREDRL